VVIVVELVVTLAFGAALWSANGYLFRQLRRCRAGDRVRTVAFATMVGVASMTVSLGLGLNVVAGAVVGLAGTALVLLVACKALLRREEGEG
jgi:hypothetical protein